MKIFFSITKLSWTRTSGRHIREEYQIRKKYPSSPARSPWSLQLSAPRTSLCREPHQSRLLPEQFKSVFLFKENSEFKILSGLWWLFLVSTCMSSMTSRSRLFSKKISLRLTKFGWTSSRITWIK